MENCIGECCLECCGRVVFVGISTAVLYVIEKQIVQRRELIIRLGRRAQTTLRIPECLCVFTEEDPGMLDGDIRFAGACLSVSYFFAGIAAFLVVTRRESLLAPWVWGFGIVNPLCVSGVIWLSLILTKRRRLRTPKEDLARLDRSFQQDVSSCTTMFSY